MDFNFDDQPSDDFDTSVDNNIPTSDSGDFTEIQQLTGTIGQKMREYGEISPKNFKYIINSIISAYDTNQLSDEDRTDIINKLGQGSVEEDFHIDDIEVDYDYDDIEVDNTYRFRASGSHSIAESKIIKKSDLLNII